MRQVGIDGARTTEAFNQWLGRFPSAGDREPLRLLAPLFALVGVSSADSQISVYDAKYHYDFWRPVTAIREGDSHCTSVRTNSRRSSRRWWASGSTRASTSAPPTSSGDSTAGPLLPAVLWPEQEGLTVTAVAVQQ